MTSRGSASGAREKRDPVPARPGMRFRPKETRRTPGYRRRRGDGGLYIVTGTPMYTSRILRLSMKPYLLWM